MKDKNLTGLEGGTLVDAAYHSLRHDIISGERHAGERLRIEKLKTLYGIGPTPLREALQKLAQEGLVVTEGNRGFTVSPLNTAEFEDLNRARIAIEKAALTLSIANGDSKWEARVVAASYLMAKDDAALFRSADGVTDSWERANTEFHTALVSACGSDWLLRIRIGLHDLCERYRRVSVYQRLGSRNLKEEHSAIAKAALARDIDRVCLLTEEHFSLTALALRDATDFRCLNRDS